MTFTPLNFSVLGQLISCAKNVKKLLFVSKKCSLSIKKSVSFSQNQSKKWLFSSKTCQQHWNSLRVLLALQFFLVFYRTFFVFALVSFCVLKCQKYAGFLLLKIVFFKSFFYSQKFHVFFALRFFLRNSSRFCTPFFLLKNSTRFLLKSNNL